MRWKPAVAIGMKETDNGVWCPRVFKGSPSLSPSGDDAGLEMETRVCKGVLGRRAFIAMAVAAS